MTTPAPRLFALCLCLCLCLCLSSLVLASQHRYDALVSAVLFDGLNTADPTADTVTVFSNVKNHADAVASILLTKARDSAFDPRGHVHTHPETYFTFLQDTASFPAFYCTDQEDDQHSLQVKGGDLDQLLDEVVNKYLGEESTRRSQIRQAFQELIPEQIEDAAWKHWALSLVTIQKPAGSDNVTFELAHVRLKIARDDKTGRAVIGPQEATLVKSSYSVMGRYISFYSAELAKIFDKATVDELVDAMTTKLTTPSSSLPQKQQQPPLQRVFDWAKQ